MDEDDFEDEFADDDYDWYADPGDDENWSY